MSVACLVTAATANNGSKSRGSGRWVVAMSFRNVVGGKLNLKGGVSGGGVEKKKKKKSKVPRPRDKADP